MINDVLDFMARRSVESMIADNTDKVEIQFTANTNNNSVDLKINQRHPYSKKVSSIGATLTKQNLAFLMDEPVSFSATTKVPINSLDYEELWNSGGDMKVIIHPETSFAEKFLNAYSKTDVEVSLPVKEFPKIER